MVLIGIMVGCLINVKLYLLGKILVIYIGDIMSNKDKSFMCMDCPKLINCDRFCCHQGHVKPEDYKGRTCHPEAIQDHEEIGYGAGEESYDVYKCHWCGTRFRVEVPM